jgi:ribose transport system substrate-binding protein
MLPGCRNTKEPQQFKIGVAVPAGSENWAGAAGWWADYAVRNIRNDYPQIDFRVVHSADAVQQAANLEHLAVWGIQVLVILPHDPAALAAPVKRLHDKGVKCIVVDRGLGDALFGYVNVIEDNAGLGRESAAWLAAAMKEEGLANYAVIGGIPTDGESVRMRAFFAEIDKEVSLVPVLGKDNYELTDEPAQNSLALTEALLKRFPKIDAMFCPDDEVLKGTLQAVREAERQDVKIILGVTGSKAVLKMILDGDPLVRAATFYNPRIIADGIQYAADTALGNTSDDFHKAKSPLTVIIPTTLIDKSNAAQYYTPDSPF